MGLPGWARDAREALPAGQRGVTRAQVLVSISVMSETPPARPTLWIALVAIAVLAVGLWLGLRQWRIQQALPAPDLVTVSPDRPPDTSMSDTSDAVIRQALAQIPAHVDSAELKSRWMDEVKGFDASTL